MLFYSKIVHALAIIFVPHCFHLQLVLSFNSIIAMEKFRWKRSSSINHYYHRVCVCCIGKSFSEHLLFVYADTEKTTLSKGFQMAGAG